jgi:hypothetical protein
MAVPFGGQVAVVLRECQVANQAAVELRVEVLLNEQPVRGAELSGRAA